MNTHIQDIIAILEENKNRKVSSVSGDIINILNQLNVANKSGTRQAKNFIKDEEGNVVAIFCYYHKRWEIVANDFQYGIEYGKKASNKATGLSTMCKEGVKHWTKANRAINAIKEQAPKDALEALKQGSIDVDGIDDFVAKKVEETKEAFADITPHSLEDTFSYESKEEVENAINEEL